MNLFTCHRLVHIQVVKMVSNLALSDGGLGISILQAGLPAPALRHFGSAPADP